MSNVTKYEGMQILEVGPLYFVLPEGFDGTVADALRLLADYHESPPAKCRREVTIPELTPEQRAVQDARWTAFLRAVDDGARVYGTLSQSCVRGAETVLGGVD